MLIDRRTILKLSATGASALTGTAMAGMQTNGTAPTPAQNIGPFYPVTGLGENMADLTRVSGQSTRARGDLVDVRGTVRTVTGRPVSGAIVLIWQANASGAYNHPRNAFGTADPGFRGHALLRTDRTGQFSLLTVRPGSYPDMPGTVRTPHIHFEVIGEEGRLITQMYFPGERLNAQDRLLRELEAGGGDPRSLIATAASEAGRDGAAALSWTVLLDRA